LSSPSSSSGAGWPACDATIIAATGSPRFLIQGGTEAKENYWRFNATRLHLEQQAELPPGCDIFSGPLLREYRTLDTVRSELTSTHYDREKTL
jgi:hypothetical protein